eukprot:2291940-Prymnesium_polylepis.1
MVWNVPPSLLQPRTPARRRLSALEATLRCRRQLINDFERGPFEHGALARRDPTAAREPRGRRDLGTRLHWSR